MSHFNIKHLLPDTKKFKNKFHLFAKRRRVLINTHIAYTNKELERIIHVSIKRSTNFRTTSDFLTAQFRNYCIMYDHSESAVSFTSLLQYLLKKRRDISFPRFLFIFRSVFQSEF